ncbi:MAG: peptidylprolyl isomerase [Gemmatimonadota bacterium]
MSRRTPLVMLLAAALAACGERAPADAVAVAAGHVLTVDEAVGLVVDETELPADRELLAQLADLWIDYTLLAEVVASDTAVGALDLDGVILPQIEREMVEELQQRALQVDTILGDDELRQLYFQELPGARIRARHILLQFDRQSAQSRDSATALASELKARLERGESFATVARTYSTDDGSKNNGGDLGFFDRQTLAPTFTAAAFALAPGQISDPVVTEFGVHLIRVDERQLPEFDSVKVAYANSVKNRRFAEAWQTFVRGLEDGAGMTVQEGAAAAARDLATDVPQPLPAREQNRVLVSFQGGTLSVGDLQAFLLTQPRALRSEMMSATDEQVNQFLEGVARGRLIVQEASDMGIAVSDQRRDTLRLDARVQLVTVADRLGLRDLTEDGARPAPAAIDSAVDRTIERIIRGEGEFVELASLALTLRARSDARVVAGGLDKALERLREERRARAPASATTGEAGVAPPLPTAPGDSAGGTR